MSPAQAVKNQEKVGEELDFKRLTALPVTKAVHYAFTKEPRTKAVLIVGPPGIGKTTNVIAYALQEARDLGKTPVIVNEARMRAKTVEEYLELVKDIYKNPDKYYIISLISFGATMPEDLMPVPQLQQIKDGSKVLATFEEMAIKPSLALLTIGGIYGTLIVDDALNAFDNVRRSFLMALFNERVVGGGIKLSPNVRVVATGNLVSESDLASPIPANIPGRAAIYYVKAEPVESWYKWMEKETGGQWYRDVYAFLKRYPNYYYNPSLADPELMRAPLPRSWSALAVKLHNMKDDLEGLLKSEDGRSELIAVCAADVGAAAAVQLVAFLSKPVVDVDDVVKDPSLIESVASDLDVAFRFGAQLAQRIEALAREKKDLLPYLKVAVDLMEKTTEDMGVYIYEMLSAAAKKELKNAVRSAMTAKDPGMKAVAKKMMEMLTDLSLAESLVGA